MPSADGVKSKMRKTGHKNQGQCQGESEQSADKTVLEGEHNKKAGTRGSYADNTMYQKTHERENRQELPTGKTVNCGLKQHRERAKCHRWKTKLERSQHANTGR